MIFLYLFLCIVAAGFFAGMETGLLGVNRIVIGAKAKKGVFYARASEYLMSKPERLLATTLIGYNLANVTAAVLFTRFMDSMGLANYTWLGILAMTVVLLIFDDLVPKSFLGQHADAVAARLSPALLIFYYLLLPVSFVLNMLIKGLLLITGRLGNRREEIGTKRDIRFLVNLAGKEVGFSGTAQKIISDIFDFWDQFAHEVMIPFHELPVAGVHQSLDEIVRLSQQTGQRFIPISRMRTDNLVGYVDVLDILWTKDCPVETVMKKVVYYPESRRIPELLLEMNKKKLDVVFLADEYGAIAGMITPGQIVGDLVHYIPETGLKTDEIRKVSPDRYLVAGTADLENLSNELGIGLEKVYASTAGGYLCERLGIIPEVGASHEASGFRFTVKRRDARRILEIEVVRAGRRGR
jgi:CBS domain containing-hemolysin-like protein